MRIAMLSWESLHSVAVGGVAAHVTELSASLARRGCEVHVFTRMAPGQKYHDLIDGVHYHRCPYICSQNFVDDVNNMCRAFVERLFTVEDMFGHFDVVHAHDWLASNALIWIKHGRPHTGVFTVHATEYARCGNAFPKGQSDRVRDQERAGTYWAERVIAVSSATRDELRWMYEVPDWKTHVVYNGVTPHRFTQPAQVDELRKRYEIGPLDPTVLFSGRLVWQKGPDLLMEAIGPLLRHRPDAKFVFAGDGEMRGQLEARARQLGVAHAVRFLGRMDNNDMPELYHMADLVCVPSRNEPFGIVVLEAWAAGKPVVVTQVGGPKEYVWHDVNGLGIQPTPDSVGWGIGTIFADFEHAALAGRQRPTGCRGAFHVGPHRRRDARGLRAGGRQAKRPRAARPGRDPTRRGKAGNASRARAGQRGPAKPHWQPSKPPTKNCSSARVCPSGQATERSRPASPRACNCWPTSGSSPSSTAGPSASRATGSTSHGPSKSATARSASTGPLRSPQSSGPVAQPGRSNRL